MSEELLLCCYKCKEYIRIGSVDTSGGVLFENIKFARALRSFLLDHYQHAPAILNDVPIGYGELEWFDSYA